jgi:ferredoxin
MSTRYRIRIDRSLCSGFGSCVELAPEAYELGPDGIANVLVHATDDPNVIEAAGTCPMGAISVEPIEEEAAA